MATVTQIQKLLEANSAANNEVLSKQLQESFKNELKAFRAEILDLVLDSLEDANQKINQLEIDVQEKADQLEQLKSQLHQLTQHSLQLQFDTKKKNLILFKVQENGNERLPLLNEVSKLIRETVDPTFEETDIDEAYRLGVRGQHTRPIKIELSKASKRTLILSNKKKFLDKNIGIAEDLPQSIIEKRKSLYKFADTLRRNGKKVVFRKEKFMVDDVEWEDEKIESEKTRLYGFRLEGASEERSKACSQNPPYQMEYSLNPQCPSASNQ